MSTVTWQASARDAGLKSVENKYNNLLWIPRRRLTSKLYTAPRRVAGDADGLRAAAGE